MSTPDEREPAPLRPDALRMIATWREADAMPRAAKARVWQRVRGDDATPRRAPMRYDAALWAFAIAAAVLLVWWGVASLRRDAIAHDDAQNVEAVDRHEAAPAGGVAVEPVRGAATRSESAPTVEDGASPTIAPSSRSPAAPSGTLPSRPRIDARGEGPPRSEPSREEPPPRAEASAPGEVSALARERDLIARAWSALAEGDDAVALLHASEHAHAFPDGLLAPERRAIEVIARCKRGDRGARQAGSEWLAAHPRSPLVNRVRVACE